MKGKNGGITIDLNQLRSMGFHVTVTDAGAHEHGELHITPRQVQETPVLRDDIAANLDMTIGTKKSGKIQRKTAALINHTILMDAIEISMT